MKIYKNILKSVIFFLILFCHYNSNAASNKYPGDTIKPLPQLNKQFNMVAYIVMAADSTAGIDSATIASVISQVNTIFSPISASFSLCEVKYIYNFDYDTIGAAKEETELYNLYWQPNRINLFFIDKFEGQMAWECGNASAGGVSYNIPVGITLLKNCCTKYVVAHELGHYFSLSHTFGNGPGITQELVNESNCATTGDNVCDTPADPYIATGGADTAYVQSCIFTLTKYKSGPMAGQYATDANGQFYDPDVTNIMSYYVECVCHFSWGQYQKMATYYLSNPIEW